jgi:hypothetical protein
MGKIPQVASTSTRGLEYRRSITSSADFQNERPVEMQVVEMCQ